MPLAEHRRCAAALAILATVSACLDRDSRGGGGESGRGAQSATRARRLTGTVHAGGAPAAGITVQLHVLGANEGFHPPGNASARTDAAGRFSIAAPDADGWFLFASRKDLAAGRVIVAAKRGPSEPIDLALAAPGALTVRVLDADGEPVPDAAVRVAHAVVELEGAARVLAAQGASANGPAKPEELGEPTPRVQPGTFRADRLFAGTWHVAVSARGFESALRMEAVDAGGERTVEVKLRRGGTVSGVVVNPAHRPLADAEVELTAVGPKPPAKRTASSTAPPAQASDEERLLDLTYRAARLLRGLDVGPRSTESDATGRFEIGDGPPGDYELRVWHRGYFESSQRVTAPVRDLTVELAPAAFIRVRVKAPAGVPAKASVAAIAAAECGEGACDVEKQAWTSASEGTVILGPLEPGEYRVLARAPGFRVAEVKARANAETLAEVPVVLGAASEQAERK